MDNEADTENPLRVGVGRGGERPWTWDASRYLDFQSRRDEGFPPEIKPIQGANWYWLNGANWQEKERKWKGKGRRGSDANTEAPKNVEWRQFCAGLPRASHSKWDYIALGKREERLLNLLLQQYAVKFLISIAWRKINDTSHDSIWLHERAMQRIDKNSSRWYLNILILCTSPSGINNL